MEPLHPRRKKPRKRVVVIGALGLMLVFFLLLVALFFIFSAAVPSLTGKCVAVVNIDMPITVTGEPATILTEGYPGSGSLSYIIKDLGMREDVGSVLFVVDSPGGSVVASQELYNSIKSLDKPKVAYFREVAASGAYYASLGTDYIVSEPAAITGSIGVISMMFEMSGLFEKIGINSTSIKSGKFKDIGSTDRPWTPEEEAIIQDIVDEVFEDFRLAVIRNRGGKLDMAEFENMTDGRIMTGKQAERYGLVDETGNKDDALLKAAELGGMEVETVDQVRVCYVSTEDYGSGLFSAAAFIKSLEAELNVPKLLYQ